MSEPYDFNPEGRQRATNYINIINNLIDTYPSGHIHGIQKDAIQNSWDARLKKDRKFVNENWGVQFELIEKEDIKLLTITDHGSCGLSGNLLSSDIENFVGEFPQKERWARWESFGWNKVAKTDLGSRGQGKMILIGGSEIHTMVYDSLREDLTYRVGWTQATITDCPVYHLEGDKGKEFIMKKYNLKPIDHIGTRIIIVNPIDELISFIKSGQFIEFIEETWWPIILNFGAKISIKYEKFEKNAEVPNFFPIGVSDKQSEHHKSIYKENIKLSYKKKSYIIKKIGIAWDLQSVPETYAGVSIFRGGMKVFKIDFIHRDMQQNVYGFVEFEENLEEELKLIELPSHDGFKTGGIWTKVKDKIIEEMIVFAKKKLGIGIDYKALIKEKRTNAQNQAVRVLRIITKNWPSLLNVNQGVGGGGGGGGDHFSKEIGVELHNLVFPDSNIPKLNWNDILSGFFGRIYNKSTHPVGIIYKAGIFSGDRNIIMFDNLNISLAPGRDYKTKNYFFKVEKSLFNSPGQYKIVLNLIDSTTNKKLDTIVRRFWVEAEPELKGLFDMKPRHFSEANLPNETEWFLSPEGDDNYIFYYNIDHPSYLDNEDSPEKQIKYISEIAMQGALQLLIKKIASGELSKDEISKLPFEIDKITSSNPTEFYLEMVKAISILKYRINENL